MFNVAQIQNTNYELSEADRQLRIPARSESNRKGAGLEQSQDTFCPASGGTGLEDTRKKSHQQCSNTRGHSTGNLAQHNRTQEDNVTHLLLHGHIVQSRLVPRAADPAQNLAHVG